ncbi:MAG TPA: aminotransferase class V-fold PLP-dependent enzyme [Actinomycetota bacterium]|nr:aminotransferase class V-fold PLP-dependent enzyme [Actinomycetota bacterium]
MVDPRKLPEMPALMIAGPGELHEEDLEVLGHQVIAHYGDVWTELHRQVIGQLGTLLGAADPPYLIPGTGTMALDAAVANVFEPGQRVVVAGTGFFGTRLREVAEAHGLAATVVPVETGAAADTSRVAEAMDRAHGLLTVQVETATGVRHPVEELAAVAHGAGAAIVVDAIASAGGERLDVDGWGIDALATGTQKGLEAPPGLGIVALGPGGRARIEARSRPPSSWYLDLMRWDHYREEWGAWHPHPVTMPTNLVLALGSSLNRLLERGIESVVATRAGLARRCRDGLRALGLEPVPRPGVEANLVVAAWADDPAALQNHLLRRGIMVSGGLEPTAGKAIRVGLMGRTATEDMVDRLLTHLAEVL